MSLETLLVKRRRGRRTNLLRTLAEDHFHGCEVCWQDDAGWYIEDVLKPLHLRVNERKRLMRVLSCPRCESPIRDYYYDRVVGYEDEEIKDAQRISHYNRKYRPAFNEFHQFLLKHPTLGPIHPFGQILRNAVRRAKKRTLQPAVWFRARMGKDLKADDLRPPDPHKHRLPPGRFNSAGQLGYYMAQARELAAIEVMGERDTSKPVWIAKVHIRDPIKVLNLGIQTLGQSEKLPLILNGLIYSGVLSDYGDDESMPQYRVPQFLADLLRLHRFDGILYTRRRDSGFPNPEASGTNLVVLRPENLRVQIDAPVLYSWKQMSFDLANLGGIALQPVNPSQQPPVHVTDITFPNLQ